jgi:hypothetical protein
MNFPQLCLPALLYFVIAIITMLFSFASMSAGANLVNLLLMGAWTWFLNFLCGRGYPIVSWFLVLAPFVFLIAIFGINLDTLKYYAGTEQPTDQQMQQKMQRLQQPQQPQQAKQ